MKSRDIVLQVVIPALRKIHPNGVVTRSELLSELERAGVPFQPWLTAKAAGRGSYDVSEYFSGDKRAQVPGAYEYAEPEEEDARTDSQVEQEVSDLFVTLDTTARGVASGAFRALVISGPPGVGKTWTAEKILSATSGVHYEKVTGFSRASGLYKLLWEHRDASHVLLLDDTDSLLQDEIALNLLKAACDSTEKRTIHWRSEKEFVDELGGDVPKKFVYEGRIVFVTNVDFDAKSRTTSTIAPHLAAMMSRAFYLDLNMSPREVLYRVLFVAKTSAILAGLKPADRDRVVAYLKANADAMREVSLRALIKLSQIITSTKTDAEFVRISNATLLRR